MRRFLVTPTASIGVKSYLKELVTVGFRLVVMVVGETAFLAGLTLGLMRWLMRWLT